MSETQKTRQIGYPDQQGLKLGYGWNSLTGEKSDTIGVVFVESKDDYGQEKHLFIESVSDRSRLMQSLEISAEFQYKSVLGRSLSAKASFAREVNISSAYESFAMKAYVRNFLHYTAPAPSEQMATIGRLLDEGKSMQEIKSELGELLPAALKGGVPAVEPLDVTALQADGDASVRLTDKALELAQRDPEEFNRQYGDSFVSGIFDGGIFNALLTFKTTMQSERTEIIASVEGSGWNMSASAKMKEILQRFDERSELSISTFQQGGSGDPMAASIDDFYDKIKRLPDLAAKNPWPFTVILQRYDSLSNWPQGQIPPKPTPYEALLRRYFEYNTLFEDMQVVRNNPLEYLLGRGITVKSVGTAQDEVHTGISAMEEELRSERNKYTIPDSAKKADYEFRIGMPLPIHYTLQDAPHPWKTPQIRVPDINPKMSGRELRDAIINYWVQPVVDNRCRYRSKSDPGCLSNAQVDDLKSKIITWDWPIIVGSVELQTDRSSQTSPDEVNKWGRKTPFTAEVASWEWQKDHYKYFHLFFEYQANPSWFQGGKFRTSDEASTKPWQYRYQWGQQKDDNQCPLITQARTWMDKPGYGRGQGQLLFVWGSTHNAAPGDIVGTMTQVNNAAESKEWVTTESQGRQTGNKHLVATFNAWSEKYEEGHGRLYFFTE